MSSTSTTYQQDLRTVFGNTEGITLAPESLLALPGSIQATERGKVNYKINTDTSPEAVALLSSIVESNRQTTADALGLTTETLRGIFATQETTQQQAGDLAESAQLGESSVFNKWLPFIILAFLGFLVLKR